MDRLITSLEAIVLGSVAVTARALVGAGAELTIVQWRVLVVLAHADEPRTVGEVARAVGASGSAASRLVGRLTRRGLVRTFDGGQDRRVRRLGLTETGERLVARVIAERDRDLRGIEIPESDAPAILRLARSFDRLADSGPPFDKAIQSVRHLSARSARLGQD